MDGLTDVQSNLANCVALNRGNAETCTKNVELFDEFCVQSAVRQEMEELHGAVGASRQLVECSDKQLHNVRAVAEQIQKIANQTNLRSLNATI